MRSPIQPLLTLALALSTFAIGCDDSTQPEALNDFELLLLADQAMSDADQDVDYVRGPGIPGFAFPGRIPGFGIGDTPECPREDGTFVCSWERPGGLTSVAEIALLDALGALQDAYDEELTASVRIQSTTEGATENGRFSGSTDRSREVMVTGLEGAETVRVWSGSSEGTSTRTHSQGPFAGEQITSTSTSIIEDLTIPLPEDDEEGWPLSGTITTNMTADGGPREGDHRIVITFDGTQFALVEIDGETMTVDLTERKRGRHHGMHGRGSPAG